MRAILTVILLASANLYAATIESIDFLVENGQSKISISADGPVDFQKQENSDDNQLVIEMSGVTLGPNASRQLDTSSFNSPISLISPYQVEGTDDQAKVVIQLREAASVNVTSEGNEIQVVAAHSGGAVAPVPTADQPPVDTPAAAPAAQSSDDKLDLLDQSRKTHRFVGKHITLQVRQANVRDVLRLIGDASGFNLVIGPQVRGVVTLSLIDVPWDHALDVVLQTARLGAERSGNVLRVLTLSNLTKEKQAEMAAKEAAQQSAPKVTRIFPVSYASLDDLKKMLGTFGKTGATAGRRGAGASKIEVDVRTNSIVVQDVLENVERMEKLVKLLDTPTPQVLIEGKIVEVSETNTESVSGSLGFGENGDNNDFAASFNNGTAVDPLLDTGASFTGSDNAGAFGVGTTIAFLPGIQRINATLSMLESESKVKVVASPKTVVLSQKSSDINQSTPVGIPETTVVDGVPTVTTRIEQSNVTLNVSPVVTNDESVLLNLTLDKGVILNDLPAPRTLRTEVLVDSGTTLVLGGIYSFTDTKTDSGFPILKDIPILGAFFGSKNDTLERTELMFFVTPTILNMNKSGLSS